MGGDGEKGKGSWMVVKEPDAYASEYYPLDLVDMLTSGAQGSRGFYRQITFSIIYAPEQGYI